MLELTKEEKIKVLIWVETLRSGVFSQTKKVLQDDEGHCCLGVACELFSPNIENAVDSSGNLIGFIPKCITGNPKWLLEINNDVFNKNNKMSLTMLNDRGASFSEIADLIENLYLK